MTTNPPDLTAPEAVERLIAWLMDAHETGNTEKNPDVWRTLFALLDALEVEKSRAEAAENTLALCEDQRREWEHHCKAAEAQLTVLKAELAAFAENVIAQDQKVGGRTSDGVYHVDGKFARIARAALRALEQG